MFFFLNYPFKLRKVSLKGHPNPSSQKRAENSNPLWRPRMYWIQGFPSLSEDEATPSRCLGYYIPDYLIRPTGIDLTFNCASRHKEPSHPEQDATFPPALLRMPFYPFTQQIAAQLGALNRRAINPFLIRCGRPPYLLKEGP
ncbi:hypothetical protein Salat_2579500 [Sesamum alatum]|uniref:Uncharacterized protein n=1 Tax=Sesamum alatum TaxID=300844 RepID=A0AAE2CA97_9LAMI|nr:hypothetical protein Salat_2579500 [Sesamum alatum]